MEQAERQKITDLFWERKLVPHGTASRQPGLPGEQAADRVAEVQGPHEPADLVAVPYIAMVEFGSSTLPESIQSRKATTLVTMFSRHMSPTRPGRNIANQLRCPN
jgi:hypothetical protein